MSSFVAGDDTFSYYYLYRIIAIFVWNDGRLHALAPTSVFWYVAADVNRV